MPWPIGGTPPKSGPKFEVLKWVEMQGWALLLASLLWQPSSTKCEKLGGVLTSMWLKGVLMFWPIQGTAVFETWNLNCSV